MLVSAVLAMAAILVATESAQESLLTFVFGDSLTEVGNNNFLQLSLAKSNYPWYGVDYEGGRATGRFTNGRTIGDIICTPKQTVQINSFVTEFSLLFYTNNLFIFLQPQSSASHHHLPICPC